MVIVIHWLANRNLYPRVAPSWSEGQLGMSWFKGLHYLGIFHASATLLMYWLFCWRQISLRGVTWNIMTADLCIVCFAVNLFIYCFVRLCCVWNMIQFNECNKDPFHMNSVFYLHRTLLYVFRAWVYVVTSFLDAVINACMYRIIQLTTFQTRCCVWSREVSR